jgi:hypothetical protein
LRERTAVLLITAEEVRQNRPVDFKSIIAKKELFGKGRNNTVINCLAIAHLLFKLQTTNLQAIHATGMMAIKKATNPKRLFYNQNQVFLTNKLAI